MTEFVVLVNGSPFDYWTKLHFEASFETVSSELSLTLTETPISQLPINLGDDLQVFVGSRQILNGMVYKVGQGTKILDHVITVTGRDQAQNIVDSSIGPKMTFNSPIDLKKVIETTVKRMGISKVGVVDEVGPEPYKKGEVVSGAVDELGFAFVEKWARKRGVFLNADGKGNIVIARSEGKRGVGRLHYRDNDDSVNVKDASWEATLEGRHHLKACASQKATTDTGFWESLSKGDSAAQAKAMSSRWGKAIDTAISPERRYYFRASKGVEGKTPDDAATWKANIDRARSFTYRAVVYDVWQDAGKLELWWPGFVVPVLDEHSELDQDMFVKAVTFDVDLSGGTICALDMGPPDAYKLKAEQDKASGRASDSGMGSGAKGSPYTLKPGSYPAMDTSFLDHF